jgi:hypothetical protein
MPCLVNIPLHRPLLRIYTGSVLARPPVGGITHDGYMTDYSEWSDSPDAPPLDEGDLALLIALYAPYLRLDDDT